MIDFSLYSLQSNPIVGFLVPFILVFAIIYAALKATSVFEGKNLNAIIAAAVAFFAVAFPPLNDFLWETMPYLAASILLLSLALVFFRMGKKVVNEGEGVQWDKYFTFTNLALVFILLSTFQNKINLSFVDVDQVLWAIGLAIAALLIAKAANEKLNKP